MPLDKGNGEVRGCEQVLDWDHWAEIRRYCRDQGITPAIYFRGLYGLLLKFYCNAEHGFVVYDIGHARIPGHGQTLGCYYQQIPLLFPQNRMMSATPVSDYFDYLRAYHRGITEHRHLSIGLQNQLIAAGQTQFFFNFYHFPSRVDFLGEDRSFRQYPPQLPHNQVHFIVNAGAEDPRLVLHYHSAYFEDMDFFQCLLRLSRQILDGAQRLGDISYLNDQVQTEARFIQHPQIPDRLYRSGDKTRLLANGEAVELQDLSTRLAQRLPDYMVPAAYAVLGAWPLTPNGKIDRKALPEPQVLGSGAGTAPSAEIERQLAAIWFEVLDVDHISIHDRFFLLGGHSLAATQVISQIRKQFGVELPLSTLFANDSIAELARAVQAARGSMPATAITLVPRDHELLLSFAQQRLWFLEQWGSDDALYNLPARLRGSLDVAVLTQAFNEIIRRHESFRTRFETVNHRPVQYADYALWQRQCLQGEAVNLPIGRPIANTRLYILDYLPDGNVEFLGRLDHQVKFRGYLNGKALPASEQEPAAALPAITPVERNMDLPLSCRQQSLEFWRQQLLDAPAMLELRSDYPRPAELSSAGVPCHFQLSSELSCALQRLSRETGVTLHMTLLAAFATLLFRYSEQDDMLIGCPVANRNQRQTESLIGYFAGTLALRTDLSGNPGFDELLEWVRRCSIAAYEHQALFDSLIDDLQRARGLQHRLLFQAMFILQNAATGNADLPGLNLSQWVPEIVRVGGARAFQSSGAVESTGFGAGAGEAGLAAVAGPSRCAAHALQTSRRRLVSGERRCG